jgi:DNA-directed RNA polymerase subunit RPC12/RpoP
VTCDKCHIKPLFVQKTSRMCVQCHRQDDIHDGELGIRCEICHVDAGFKIIKKLSP